MTVLKLSGTQFSKNRMTNLQKNLWKSLTYEKLTKILWKTKDEVMQNLGKTYDDITGIIRKRKIRIKWCHSGNPLSEAVISWILWAKNNRQPVTNS